MRTRQALIHEDLAGDNNSGKEISIMSGENIPQVNSEIFYPESRTKRSPFDCSDCSTRTLMGQMCIAMILLGGVGIYRYGLHAAMVLAVTSVGSILTELVIGFLMKRGNTTGDCSAAVSGLILGLLLPPMIPLRYALLGAAVSMAVKNLSGGIGKNIVNPALCGKFFLLLVFRSAVSDYSCAPYGPISILTEMTSGQNVQILPMLTGDCASDIGTGSAAAVLLVTALLVRRHLLCDRTHPVRRARMESGLSGCPYLRGRISLSCQFLRDGLYDKPGHEPGKGTVRCSVRSFDGGGKAAARI